MTTHPAIDYTENESMFCELSWVLTTILHLLLRERRMQLLITSTVMNTRLEILLTSFAENGTSHWGTYNAIRIVILYRFKFTDYWLRKQSNSAQNAKIIEQLTDRKKLKKKKFDIFSFSSAEMVFQEITFCLLLNKLTENRSKIIWNYNIFYYFS